MSEKRLASQVESFRNAALGLSKTPIHEREAAIRRFYSDYLPAARSSLREKMNSIPAARFTTDPLWDEARWTATSFRWHPKSEAPPIMGLLFENAEPAKELFRKWSEETNHKDEFEEVRVSIIRRGDNANENAYSVHIAPDRDGLAARATFDDIVLDPITLHLLSQWNRHFPVVGQPKMLPKFKMEFEKHNEFLLAPAVKRSDGQIWYEPTLGVIKTVVHFRDISEITPDDPDAAAILLPQLVTPPK